MKSFKTIVLIMMLAAGFNSLYAQKSDFPPNNMGKMLGLYLDIKNALIRNDGTTAKLKAEELHHILITQPDKGLESREIPVLADNLVSMIDDTRGIGYTVDENTQRRYFANLTIGMYRVVKALRLNRSKIYMQYCAINKAYWLSETPVIKNPYYNYDGWSKIGRTTDVLPRTILAD